MRLLYSLFKLCFNPFTPRSDQKGISSYNIDTSLSEKVMRRDKNTIYETLFDVRPTSLRENFEKCVADCLECGYYFLSERGRWATSWFVCLERKMPRVFQLVVFVYSTLTILALVCVIQDVFRSSFNPLRLNISMHILHNIFHTIPKVLTRRMRLTIKSFFSWWSFPLFSWP